MAGLLKFLRSSEKTEFIYGQSDCVQWVCRYIELETGINPGGEFTRTYANAERCNEILVGGGGLLTLTRMYFGMYADKIVPHNGTACVAGHIYVVRFGNLDYMALGTHAGWAIKKHGCGFHVLTRGVKVLGAWELRKAS
jgi:hypothetical protein